MRTRIFKCGAVSSLDHGPDVDGLNLVGKISSVQEFFSGIPTLPISAGDDPPGCASLGELSQRVPHSSPGYFDLDQDTFGSLFGNEIDSLALADGVFNCDLEAGGSK